MQMREPAKAIWSGEAMVRPALTMLHLTVSWNTRHTALPRALQLQINCQLSCCQLLCSRPPASVHSVLEDAFSPVRFECKEAMMESGMCSLRDVICQHHVPLQFWANCNLQIDQDHI